MKLSIKHLSYHLNLLFHLFNMVSRLVADDLVLDEVVPDEDVPMNSYPMNWFPMNLFLWKSWPEITFPIDLSSVHVETARM